MSYRSDVQESSKEIRECLRDIREALKNGDRVYAYRIAQELLCEANQLEHVLRCASTDGTVTSTVNLEAALNRMGQILSNPKIVELVNE